MGYPGAIAIAVLVLAAIDIIVSRGRSFTAWGLALLAVAFIWSRL